MLPSCRLGCLPLKKFPKLHNLTHTDRFGGLANIFGTFWDQGAMSLFTEGGLVRTQKKRLIPRFNDIILIGYNSADFVNLSLIIMVLLINGITAHRNTIIKLSRILWSHFETQHAETVQLDCTPIIIHRLGTDELGPAHVLL